MTHEKVAAGTQPDASSRPLTGKSQTPPKGAFRPDVEGLRAVAVVAVLLYHASVPFAPGGYVGVDVFFVISGFLITGLLLREIEKTDTLSITRFYSRRAKRLLPLTVVVLGAVAVVSWPLFDPVRMDRISWDIIAAGLYVMNWRLAVQATDYFGAGLQASPVQHFWTLGVEEQFYLIWPTLLLAVAWWCRRLRWSLRPVLGVVFAIVMISSMAYSVYSTEHEGTAAYFSTLTRGWELALGGALALVPVSHLKRMPDAASVALAWVGLGAIALATYRLGDGTPYPGTAALLPTLGTAAIIAAGASSTSAAPTRLLSLRPVRHVGRISYSWYLWHWPPLVFAAATWGKLSPLEGLAVLSASYIPAVLTYRLVERPLHYSEMLSRFPSKALALGAACTASSVALGLALLAVTPTVTKPPLDQVAGAAALHDGPALQKSADAVRPTPREADKLRSKMYTDGCHVQPSDTKFPECVYGRPSSKTTVVLFGDSHAMHWFPALDKLAKERNWRLVGLTKSACPPAKVTRYNVSLRREYRECDEWRERALRRIAKENPDLVVTSGLTVYTVVEDGKRLGRDASEVALEDGYVATLKELRSTGAKVAVIEDVPHPNKNMPECVSRSLDRLEECAFPRSKAFRYPPINTRAAERVEGAELIDPTPVLCPGDPCPAVIGDALVYRNGDHLTSTYVRTLTPWLARQLPEPTTNSREQD